MTYDTDTFRKTIGQMTDQELLRRLHLEMFTEEAHAVAQAEAARRNLVVDSAELDRSIEIEINEARNHRSRAYVNTLTALAGFSAATNLGILGGLAFTVPGHWIGTKLDSYLRSRWARFLGGVGVLAIGASTAKVIQLVLASVFGLVPT